MKYTISSVKDKIEYYLRYNPDRVIVRKYEKILLGGFREIDHNEECANIEDIMKKLVVNAVNGLLDIISIAFQDARGYTLEIKLCIQ